MKKYYLITEEELKELPHDSFELNALNCGGVDNWEWGGDSISDAIEDYNRELNTSCESIEDIVEIQIPEYQYIMIK